jgi:sigma-B regulation protein RsbU (phosphoserine phosphatase)
MQAGGDFYDVIPVGEGVVDYVVADASGHDLAASFWTAALKTLLNEYATAADCPLNILRSLNSALGRILPTGVFFTMIYARLNRQTGKLLLANAGHPPALVLRTGDTEAAFVEQEGDVLGAFEEAVYEVTELELAKGDRFFLYSDGLLDVAGGREQGMQSLPEACSSQRLLGLGDTVRSVVSELAINAVPEDDILLMGVEV